MKRGVPLRAARRSRSLLILSLLLSSCYNPDYAQADYACGPQVGTCPTGYQCVAGTCKSPGADLSLAQADLSQAQAQPGADLSTAGQDLRTPPQPDLRTTADLRTSNADLRTSTPDLSVAPDLGVPPADMSVPGGCSGTGIAVSADNKVYACNGDFDTKPKNSPDKLCAANFHLCNLNDGAELMLVDEATCRKTGGFYAANINAMLFLMNGANAVNCPVAGTMADTLVGCGSQSGTEMAADTCKGLKDIYHCGDQSVNWSCMTNLGDASHSSAADVGGVLCCAG